MREGDSRRGRLFWQMALVLLPVLLLSGFALYSLRQDRRAAEEEARESGIALARQLAQAVAGGAGPALRNYRQARSYSAALAVKAAYGDGATESSEAGPFREWCQANPEMDLDAQPPAEYNRFFEAVSDPFPPAPAAWPGRLTPQQNILWQKARAEEFREGDFGGAERTLGEFIASQPSEEARINAKSVIMLAGFRHLALPQAAGQIAAFVSRNPSVADIPGETGLRLGQSLAYELLHRLPDGAGIPDDLLQEHRLVSIVLQHPSALTPLLVAEAKRVAIGSAGEPEMEALGKWWHGVDSRRAVWESFRSQHPAEAPNPGPYWVGCPVGTYLLTLDKKPTATGPSFGLIPQAVVAKALVAAWRQSGILIPPYAAAEIELAEKRFDLSTGAEISATNRPEEVLGLADGVLARAEAGESRIPFQVHLALTAPGQLYARQTARARLLGGLVLAAAAVALLGLAAVWQSFQREQRLNEMKSNFVSSVSHELRAPIASVRLLAENLAADKVSPPARQKEYFHFIVQECRRLSSLVENVLDFSRIDQGRKQYEMEPVDLGAVLRSAVALMEPAAAERGVALKLEPHGGAPAQAVADGRAIQQALVNLIDNAIKHSRAGQSVAVGMEAGASPGGNTVRLVVADQGPGIPAAEQAKIFERFYRLGSELRRETQGAGIGLSIVKHIVEAHHGRVTVQSEPGRGSRFTLELPLEP